MAWPAGRSRSRQPGNQALRGPDALGQAAPCGGLPGRCRLPRAARPRQGAVPKPSHRQVDHRQTQPDHPRPGRRCFTSPGRTGPCGVGKTWRGCALAQAACRDGVTVVYKRMPRLFEDLELAHGPSRACKHALPMARQCMFTCMRGGNGRPLPPVVAQHHQSTTADPPLSLIAFAINCRAMDDWGRTGLPPRSAEI